MAEFRPCVETTEQKETSMTEGKTIFGKIVDGEIPSEPLYEDEHCIVIQDINPQAPTHVLIIPRDKDIPRLVDANESHQALLGHLLLVAGRVSKQLGVEDSFRLVINNGAAAGQTVFHLHLHIIANKAFEEDSLGKELS
jgi:histidine triad (HIT) family protein